MKYPTGVENHGGKLRIWFVYKGVRVRENLGVPDTAKNRRVAGELRSSVCYAIKTGVFDYAKQFPSSRNLEKFGEARQDLTIKELAEKFLALKETEVAKTSLNTYRAVIKNILSIIGEKNLASSINKEKLLEVRKELLTGYQIPKSNYIVTQPGRSAVTVNNYMTNLNAVFQFGVDNGYLADNPFKGISPLKESRTIPDPLSREEFIRLIDACRNQQAKNLWCVSVYTGVRPGELCALGWEDIDLKNGTMMIRRNLAKDRFTVPKTQAGTNRVIHLIKPAIDALRSQMTLTRLSKEHIIDVHLREYGRTEKHKCTFVFQPEVSARVKNYGDHFTVDSLKSERPSGLTQAIIEVGRINKTLYLLNYIDDEDYRRRILTQLNRGESRHAVARAICHGQKGEIRKRYTDGQEDQLGALGLVTNAVVLWNTIYMQAALDHLRAQGETLNDEDIARLSPLCHGHINMLGHYSFTLAELVTKGHLRPLKEASEAENVA